MVGEQLKNEREAQHLTVTQVAEMTKIRSDHIRAIDQGNYDVFSAPVYIRGFVRTYAAALKLDGAQIITQLNKELAEAGGATAPPFPAPATGLIDSAMFHLSTGGRRMLLPAAGVLVVFAAVMTIYYAVRRHQAANPLEGLSPGLYQSPTAPMGDTLPLPKH
jgi:cytoskeletal protein RodZ